ncbi:GSCFA domain-containing protein [Hymenobacter sp. 15J16-1T3B]|uniref:GSCFA domain-containing protein n=1 Tax=Hymenobacter sp. 15J16-1T3B TaxID=2886941 RepID=UPI001D123FC9|nr:GSCFA domain-containing protein [Hymenobacter sp. 15J16-1T3B]MCC3157333.1 GSCFA domain-containing protein [Hymenobacter sp. 15J16-1T3B]
MFRTELSLRPAAQLLSHGARVLTIGSCFSDVIGERLTDHKVRTLVNPFGTVFNPLAAARLLRAVAGEDTDWQQHLVEARGRWQSYDLHASVGADSPPALLERIEETVRETAAFARRADVLVWTLGTAYAYRLRDTGEVVNNCHKVPADRFEKELLTAEEIVSAVTEAYALLRQQNPQLRLVLTVSPVRHLKDTLPLNAVSKSVLRVACHYLSELLPGASYFPAYELLLDDLRDYRFYGDDMIHPSNVAEQYVWEKFTGVYFEPGFKQFVQEWDGIQRALHHRPLHEGAPEHREFLEQTLKRLERLLSRHVDVRLELLDVQDRLAALPAPAPPAPAEDEDDGEERIDVGYEDAAATPAAPKAVEPVEAAPPKVTEPTWAEILSAEAEADEEEDEFETSESTSSNEAEAALPGELGAGKRRKRKRGGRKHKKKNRTGADDAAAATVEGSEAAVSAEATVAAETALVPASAENAEAATSASADEAELPVNAEPALPPVELPAVEAPIPTSAAKRRNRSKRKKPALYAEPVATEEASAQDAAANSEPAAESTAAPLLPAEAPALAESALGAPAVAIPDETPAAPADFATGEAPTAASDEAASPVEETPRAKPRRASRSPRKPSKVTPALDAGAESLPLPAAPALPELPAMVEAAAPETSATEPAPAPETPAPRRRAAPRRKPAPSTPPAAEATPAPTPTPEAPSEPAAAPKRRSRPPRRKPDEPAAS